jgi:ATP-dependent Zn protease
VRYLFDSASAEREEIAIHEGAHAVVAWALGQTIHEVTIAPKQPLTRRSSRAGEDAFFEDAIIRVAGMMAGTRLTGSSKRAARGGWGDKVASRSAFERKLPDLSAEVEKVLQVQVTREAYALVARYWDDIRRIAKALLQEETILETRFESLLAGQRRAVKA